MTGRICTALLLAVTAAAGCGTKAEDSQEELASAVTITPAELGAKYSWLTAFGDKFTAWNNEMIVVVKWAFRTRGSRIAQDAPLPPGKFDITIKLDAPADRENKQATRDEVRRKLNAALKAHYGLTVVVETRPVDVLILRAKGNDKKGLKPPKSPKSGGSSGISGPPGGRRNVWLYNRSTDDVAQFLDDIHYMPVFNETGIEGKYDTGWPYQDAGTFKPGVTNTLGKTCLTLTKEKRELEVVVVKRAKP